MPGPAPKVDPIRRNPRSGPVSLPAEGRKGDPPNWPLTEPPSAEEWEAWEQLWSTPQAVAWERLGWTRTVARYCRVMVAAEERGANAALLGQAVALEDRLGLTPKAMRMLLWQIVDDEVKAKREQPKGTSARSRLKAVG
jgi:hypothetical protein